MQILGLLDSLESTILDGFKIPMTKKTIINEEQVLILIDKIRLVAQGGADFVKKAIDKDRIRQGSMQEESNMNNQQTSSHSQVSNNIQASIEVTSEIGGSHEKTKGAEIISQAYQIAKEVREGADKYADEVLSNLELTSTRVLRTIKAGRERLQKNVQGSQVSETINV